MKRLISIFLILCALLCVSSCAKKDYDVKKIDNYVVSESKTPTNYIRIVMEDGGAMLIELYPETAPITVENFKNLVAEKYYDGITFHRVDSGFMIQGGDPNGDGISNGDKPTIKGEFAMNGVQNDLSHDRGVISMARATDPNSASTQFFIMHYKNTGLDGQYAAFGKMLAGFSTLDKIANTETYPSEKPVKDQTMAEVRFVNIVEVK